MEKKFFITIFAIVVLQLSNANSMEQSRKSNIHFGKLEDEKNSFQNQFLIKPNEKEKKLLEQVLINCPYDEINEVLDQEKNFTEYSTRINILLLVGIPGVGKTLLAKSLGCELGKCYFISSGDLLREHRNGTSERLKKIINFILEQPGKKIVVLDEINKLLENYASEHKDSSETASTLWEIIDSQKDNPDFFLIATANESKTLPPQIQDRFGMSIVEIRQPSQDQRQSIIKELIFSCKIKKSQDLEKHFDELVNSTQDCTPRELFHIISAAERKAFLKNENNPELNTELLKEAIASRIKKNKIFWDKSIPLSEDERRFNEKIQKNKEINDLNIKLQKELQKENIGIQEKHHLENYEFQLQKLEKDVNAHIKRWDESKEAQEKNCNENNSTQLQQIRENIEIQKNLAKASTFQQTMGNANSIYWQHKEKLDSKDHKHITQYLLLQMKAAFLQIFPGNWDLGENETRCDCNECNKAQNENSCNVQ